MATRKEIINHFIISMDVVAQEQFGEFGYDTCTNEQKIDIIDHLIDLDLITQ